VTGAPVLLECAAWVEGNVLSRVPLGDHEGFLIAVRAAGAGRHRGTLLLSDTPALRAGHPADETPAARFDDAIGMDR
jgi:flavin reductase (DIM6/NTAB) family NADH-FMN oxidoreductase RutF